MSLIDDYRYIRQQYNNVCDMLMHVCDCMKNGNEFDEAMLEKMAQWHQGMLKLALNARGKVDLGKAANSDNKME